MVRPSTELGSLRLSRLERSRLLLALLFSLLVHLGAWGGYEAEKKFGWWSKLSRPVLHLFPKAPARPVVPQMPPVVFLDVAEPSAEAPKQAKYYSDKNSRAANPDNSRDLNQPKLDGQQRDIPKTEDVPKPVKAQPAPPKPAEAKPAQANPANTLMPGGMEKAKPDKPAAPERPRTLREALAVQPNKLAGRQMQQDGGVQRHKLTSSMDAIATPFGQYDRDLIAAVQQRWDDLLDSQQFAMDRKGKVTVIFRLHPDGTVTESKIDTNSVGDLLGYVCQQAIEQAAPFGPWPPDMRRMVGSNFREITFTFYYY